MHAWTEPTTESPPGGNIGPPINVSETSQAKTGDLTVGKVGITSSPDFSVFGQICLNDICQLNWPTLSGDFVALQPSWPGSPNSGFAYVKAQEVGQQAAIVGEGMNNPPAWIAGVYGKTADTGTGLQYGVFGYARLENSAAVGGKATGANSYAGYFKGSVLAESGDLHLLKINQANPLEEYPKLCLYGEGEDCRNYWDREAQERYWAKFVTAAERMTYLKHPENIPANLVLGDYTTSGKNTFMIDYNSGAMTIGDPVAYLPPDLPVEYTCGDGLCNGSETNASCPADCPALTICNVDITTTANSATISWWTYCPPNIVVSTGWVEYGVTSDYGQTEASAMTGLAHSVQLTNLENGTTYHFRIVAKEQPPGQNSVFTSDIMFTTKGGSVDPEDPEINILYPKNYPDPDGTFDWNDEDLTIPVYGTAQDNTGISNIKVVLISNQEYPYYSYEYQATYFESTKQWSTAVNFFDKRNGFTYDRYGSYVVQATATDSSSSQRQKTVAVNIFRKQCQVSDDVDPLCPVSDKYCVSNLCVECRTVADCAPPNDRYCADNKCIECSDDSECTRFGYKVCCEAMGICVAKAHLCPVEPENPRL